MFIFPTTPTQTSIRINVHAYSLFISIHFVNTNTQLIVANIKVKWSVILRFLYVQFVSIKETKENKARVQCLFFLFSCFMNNNK